LLTAAFAALAALGGALTVLKYNSQRGFIGPGLYGVHAFAGRDLLVRPSRWDGAVFVNLAAPARKLPHPAEHAMFNIMRVNWLNAQALKTPQDITPFLPLRAVFLVRRGPAAVRINPPGSLLYENNEYQLFDSGLPLSAFTVRGAEPDFARTFSPA